MSTSWGPSWSLFPFPHSHISLSADSPFQPMLCASLGDFLLTQRPAVVLLQKCHFYVWQLVYELFLFCYRYPVLQFTRVSLIQLHPGSSQHASKFIWHLRLVRPTSIYRATGHIIQSIHAHFFFFLLTVTWVMINHLTKFSYKKKLSFSFPNGEVQDLSGEENGKPKSVLLVIWLSYRLFICQGKNVRGFF